ncbi:MAG: hypothetical protein LBS91_04590 [Clostridiales Family XIII bacterium]|jgi:hypothetical protein|nr:hypothetical protein [Clostridiales Family XIII bacterium]
MHVPFSEETRANLREVFDDAFMREYTKCANLDEFMFSSAVFVNWDDAALVYSKQRFDAFVAETTRFGSWEEMLRKGAEDYAAR